MSAANDPHAEAAEVGVARKRRPVTDYERGNAAKRAMGARMREVRETANIGLEDMARRLGYAQPVQVSTMETGKRPALLHVLLGYAHHCGTTMDYLCGLTTDADRDTTAAFQELIAARLSADMRNLHRGISKASIEMVKVAMPGLMLAIRMSLTAMEVKTALQTVRRLNPSFDEDVRGANPLVSKIEAQAVAAQECIDRFDRAKRATHIRGLIGGDSVSLQLFPVEVEDFRS